MKRIQPTITATCMVCCRSVGVARKQYKVIDYVLIAVHVFSFYAVLHALEWHKVSSTSTLESRAVQVHQPILQMIRCFVLVGKRYTAITHQRQALAVIAHKANPKPARFSSIKTLASPCLGTLHASPASLQSTTKGTMAFTMQKSSAAVSRAARVQVCEQLWGPWPCLASRGRKRQHILCPVLELLHQHCS